MNSSSAPLAKWPSRSNVAQAWPEHGRRAFLPVRPSNPPRPIPHVAVPAPNPRHACHPESGRPISANGGEGSAFHGRLCVPHLLHRVRNLHHRIHFRLHPLQLALFSRGFANSRQSRYSYQSLHRCRTPISAPPTSLRPPSNSAPPYSPRGAQRTIL